ncbi:hypothetical protein [Peptostreptococcus russellii]
MEEGLIKKIGEKIEKINYIRAYKIKNKEAATRLSTSSLLIYFVLSIIMW